jgi:hypothetical protein
VIGLVGAELARTDTRAIATSVRTAFGSSAGQLDESVWSDPLALPASAGSLSGRQADAAAPDRIRAYAALVSGSWPGLPQPGQPIPAAIPIALAAALHAKPGAVVTLRDLNTRRPIRLQISALYRQRDPGSPYWDIGRIWTCGATSQGCAMSRGPVVVSPAAFGPGGLTVDQASWVVLPDAARIRPATSTRWLPGSTRSAPGCGTGQVSAAWWHDHAAVAAGRGAEPNGS